MQRRAQPERFPREKSFPSATGVIPKSLWQSFVEEFGRSHRGCLMALVTTDLETGETATSLDMCLQTIDFDLEDEKNPRINVTATLDNKTFTHVLFLPSQVVLHASNGEEWLEIETLNTRTEIRIRTGSERKPRKS
jgi:hypothetical protein